MPQCQNRGRGGHQGTRGLSRRLSAANGAIDHVKSLLAATPANDWVSAARRVEGRVRRAGGAGVRLPDPADGKGNLKVVEGLTLDAFGKEKFETTLKELLEEQDAVKDLLPS